MMHMEQKYMLVGLGKFHYRWVDGFGEKLRRAQTNFRISLKYTHTLNEAQ